LLQSHRCAWRNIPPPGSEFVSIASPDQDREELLGVGPIQIEECWVAATSNRKVSASHYTANSRLLSYVKARLSSGQRLAIRGHGA
jgi:hypothetical protein